jgi:hypothetical protein
MLDIVFVNVFANVLAMWFLLLFLLLVLLLTLLLGQDVVVVVAGGELSTINIYMK